MAEDVVIDGEYVDSAVKAALGFMAGSTYAVYREADKLDDPRSKVEGSFMESAGLGVFFTGSYEVVDEATDYLNGTDIFQLEDYPEYWAGAALGHRGAQKMIEKLQ